MHKNTQMVQVSHNFSNRFWKQNHWPLCLQVSTGSCSVMIISQGRRVFLFWPIYRCGYLEERKFAWLINIYSIKYPKTIWFDNNSTGGNVCAGRAVEGVGYMCELCAFDDTRLCITLDRHACPWSLIDAWLCTVLCHPTGLFFFFGCLKV